MSINSEQKQDIRVEKTRRALVQAMFALLGRESFQKITVNDLCLEALCSRATFYAHFLDKYDLLRYSLERMGEQLRESAPGGHALVERVVRFVHERPEIFHNLLMEETNRELSQMLAELFTKDVMQRLEQWRCPERPLTAPVELWAVFITGGIASLFLWWIASGFEISEADMTRHLREMIDRAGA